MHGKEDHKASLNEISSRLNDTIEECIEKDFCNIEEEKMEVDNLK